MKGALAWLIGIPIPIIIVLYLLDVFSRESCPRPGSHRPGGKLNTD